MFMLGKDVQKFGGNDKLGQVVVNDNLHEAESIEVKSERKLEDDTGYGNAVIIRCFTFGMNPQAFQNQPTKQELFNSHIKGIEVMLWRDGMTIMTEVEPRILIKDNQYQIFVGARPMRGYILKENPQKLKQIIYG